ncbi:MAG: bifunctional glutamate N-acetyltransferase/amino-acid acetyltransferase ArgJ [Candidatus Omnitrophica bacterium]|nr:bifunctional glutamate N-acetyltransferase/amino-acid acetyltransferase ArgJ [Candidatus Omnitrophota bacterium]
MNVLVDGTISSPLGFKSNGLCCGIRSSKPDLALIYSIVPAQAVGMFTRNRVKAAPVLICQRHLRRRAAQVIVANSGNANCCTGERGMRDARQVVAAVARQLRVAKQLVLPASTGVIGKYLPVEKILAGVPALATGLNFDRAAETARAIMTTDRFPKQLAVELKIGGKRVVIGAVAKGAGMICPDMATMLCFITTDVKITAAALRAALRAAVADSFNCISVDGDMSTNDAAIILANGLADNRLLTEQNVGFKQFTAALRHVCTVLAKQMVEDGEGATKIIEIRVEGAKTPAEAKRACRQMANSPLIKTMIAGENPNWGRIPAAIGAAGVNFAEKNLEIVLQGQTVYARQQPLLKDYAAMHQKLKTKEVQITVRLRRGNCAHRMWASDFTQEYVRINTEYN